MKTGREQGKVGMNTCSENLVENKGKLQVKTLENKNWDGNCRAQGRVGEKSIENGRSKKPVENKGELG